MTHSAMDRDKIRPVVKTPDVLKKLKKENLLVIERGLLGDIPDKLRPPFIPVRGQSNDLQVAKPSGLLSACLPIIPDSPRSEKLEKNPWDEEHISPLKKSFSFREKFSKIGLFQKDKHEKPKYKTISEDEKVWDNNRRQPKDILASPKLDRRSAKAEHDYKSNKRFWFFRNKEMANRSRDNYSPIYQRSKSFEFLPRAMAEQDEKNPKKTISKQNSFAFGSSDTMAEVWSSNESLDYPSDVYYNNDDGVFLKSIKEVRVPESPKNSSISTENSGSGGIVTSIFKRESVQDLLEEFDKAVHMFSENYVSDSEVYAKTKDVSLKEKRKSASFSTFPSSKVVQVSTVSKDEVFKKELSKVLSIGQRRSTVAPASPRRGSATDWFILEDKNAVPHGDHNKYKRAQKKPLNRVRRVSSTKYWITPEECAVYSREQRPPLIIPRITQYRPPPPRHNNNNVYFDSDPARESRGGHYERLPPDDSPNLERSFNSDSPPFGRLNSRLGASSEYLNLDLHRRKHRNIPASSSGDSLDIEMRERDSGPARRRESRSMMAPMPKIKSPKPTPRRLVSNQSNSEPNLFQPLVVRMQGPVKRTQYSQSGKKRKKNWIECYMVLSNTAVYFFRDQKTSNNSVSRGGASSPGGAGGAGSVARADLVLPLQNAHVVACIQSHTSRYTRSIMLTVNYDIYLIQDDTEDGAKRWLMAIQNVVYKLGPPLLDELPPSQSASSTDVDSLGRTPPAARHNNRNKQKAGGSSNEDLSDSTEVSIQRSHVRSRLRKFFAKRPAMEVLIKKGIYKDEPVFGRNLEEVCPATSPRVPDFVVACVREIESCDDNMKTDGLYRASGNLSQVQKIRLEIDQNNLSVIENSSDIHVLTGSLKLFLRELKEPLIPFHVFDRILAACSLKPREARIKEFREVMQTLPQCNLDTLKFLLEHLIRVTQYSEYNRMHSSNVAIVFGPTLLWAPRERRDKVAVDCILQNNVVDILLNDYKLIFNEQKKKA